jgi:hypothetical protein
MSRKLCLTELLIRRDGAASEASWGVRYGYIQLNSDGTIDRRSPWVQSGEVVLKPDGHPDKRCAAANRCVGTTQNKKYYTL